MNKRRKKKTEPRTGLSGFLLESKAAILIVLCNFAAFWYIHFEDVPQLFVQDFILSPGSILEGRVWSLVTAGFIHGSWSHLLLNMLGVLIFGRIVERNLGAGKTLYIYLGAMVISMAFAMAIYAFGLQKTVGIIGASGAVMGLVGTAVLLEPFCITYEMILPIPTMVKGWMFLYADWQGFLGGERDGVSHLSHLLGFISIGLLVYFLSQQDKARLRSGLLVNVFSFLAFLALREFGPDLISQIMTASPQPTDLAL